MNRLYNTVWFMLATQQGNCTSKIVFFKYNYYGSPFLIDARVKNISKVFYHV